MNAKILVVDDERIVSEDICECLEHIGYNVVGVAISGLEAIEKAAREKPDLVLMDIVLQGDMDGIAAADMIRKRLDIPVVFLTAYSHEGVLSRAKNTEPYGYIVKPFDEGSLRSAVEIALYKANLEKALRASKDWLFTTLRSITDGIIATDVEGRIQFMNGVAENLVGWKGEEAGGRSISEVFVSRDDQSGEPLEAPALCSLRKREPRNAQRSTLVSRDKREVPVSASSAPIFNEKQELAGAVIVFRDITERLKAELRDKEYQVHLQKLVDERTHELQSANKSLVEEIDERKRAQTELEYRVRFQQLISRISTDMGSVRVEEIDAGIERSLQRLSEFLEADRAYVFLIDSDGAASKNTHEWGRPGIPSRNEGAERVPAAGCLWNQTETAPGGGILVPSVRGFCESSGIPSNHHQLRGVASLIMVPLLRHRQVMGYIGADAVTREIRWAGEQFALMRTVGEIVANALQRREWDDEREELRHQLNHAQKMEAIGKLSGGIAHDFNNMLVPIIGYSDMLLHEPNFDGGLRDAAKEIKRAAESAASLTRQLLAFSRKQIISKSVWNLNSLIGKTQNMLTRLIGENIELVTRLDSGLLSICADAGQIEQVIINLAINARDAMPEGGKLTISTANTRSPHPGANGESQQWAALEVRDSGVGMDRATLDRIFEPFFTTKGQEGTGVGLSVVYGIVQQHGGVITAQSAPGKGAVFTVYFQGIEAEPEKDEPEAAVAPSGSLKGKGERILLVEDEPGVIKLVSEALRSNGYEVFPAMHAKQAIETFDEQEGKFDLIFSDAVLPDQSGIELLEILLSRNPRLRALLSSGYTDKVSLLSMAQQREISFLQKPYSLPKLFQTVSDVMRGVNKTVLN